MDENRLRVAIIVPGGIGTGKGNMGVPVMERLVKLLSRDFDVTVFSLFSINKDYSSVGFELIDCGASNFLSRIIKFCSIFLKVHRDKKFHVVHGFWVLPCGFLAVVLGRIFHIKSVVSVLGGDAISLPAINYGQLRRWLPRQLVLWCLHRADEVICLTNYLLNNLKGAGLKRNDVKIIPWGVDTSLFTFREKALNSPVRFLHIANLSPVKDQTTLIKAFKIIVDKIPAHLTIIGEGSAEQFVKIFAHSLNVEDKINFKHVMPYEDLVSHYHQADVLLHTSLSEGQSEVVTEAMSCGVLVCGTKVGLMYDQPTCCISVPVQEAEMLAQEVLKILHDAGRINMIRRNAYAWSSAHSIHWTAAEVSKLYRLLVKLEGKPA